METAADRVASLLSRRWEAGSNGTQADHEALCADVLAVLDHPDVTTLSRDQFVAVVGQIFQLYLQSWSRTALRVAPSLERVVQYFLQRPETTLEDACNFYEPLYFLYWSASTSIDQMRGFGPGVVEPFAAYARRSAPRRAPADQRIPEPPFRLVYLGRFLAGDPIYQVTRSLLRSVLEHQSARYRPILYAWVSYDEDALQSIEAQGIAIRRFPEQRVSAMGLADRIDAIKQALIEDGVDLLISDMNSSVPAVLFEHRVAPIQIYYQLGMPAWPLREIDHILRVWEFGPRRAGFDPAICSTLTAPWDQAELAPPPDLALIAVERERMPKTRRLFGTYARLIKITPEFLAIVAELLRRHPDLGIVLGGTGDGSHIREFASRHGFPANRFRLVEEHVDGHTWGQLLDVFLDTFGQQGGFSCREMIAKGRPVLTTISPDMPNLARERVTFLTAADEQEYLTIASRLAADDEFLGAAQAATRALAERMPGRAEYAAAFDRAVSAAITRRRERGAPAAASL